MHPSIEQYLNFLHSKRRALATLKVIRQDLTHYVQWWESARQRTFDSALLRHEDLRDWRAVRQRDDGAALATINRGLAWLRGYCRWALAHHLLLENPMADVRTCRRNRWLHARCLLKPLTRCYEQRVLSRAPCSVHVTKRCWPCSSMLGYGCRKSVTSNSVILT
jgi:site-specific recombinase XerD